MTATLGTIVEALAGADLLVAAPTDTSLPVTGVTEDSRAVSPGTVFCAVEGTADDGHRYVRDAAGRGAAAVLVTRPEADPGVPQVVVRDSRAAAAHAAAAWYGRPGDTLRLVGVTGTNGKSTTVALICHLLNDGGTAGMLGTLGAARGDGAILPGGSGLTTPGPVELQRTLAALRDAGCTTVVMEASSHALHQRRLAGLRYAAGVYTNLTHDHLDYHGDYDAYLAAKMLLSAQLSPDGVEVVNADDPAWTALPARGGPRVRFGFAGDAEVRATDVTCTPEGTRMTLHLAGEAHAVTSPLLGEFNVSNALGAAACAWGLGAAPARVAERLASAPQVPGRMERLASEQGWVVLRDYAHTPDALKRVLTALRPLVAGRLIVLFGCGGDRDRRKRAPMGEIAARGADVAIVTSDNPRTEDPEQIMDDIEDGMQGVAHIRLVNRRDAIARGLAMLEPGDCLLLAGKGHETYQIIGTERLPFDERDIVRHALGSAA